MRERADVSRPPGDIVANLLGQSPVWTPGIVSDAQYAVKEAVKGVVLPAPRAEPPAIVGRGVVTAVVSAAESGDLFIAFENGELVCFSPRRGEMRIVRAEQWGSPIRSLATSLRGDLLVASCPDSSEIVILSRHADQFRSVGRMEWNSVAWLSPTLALVQGQWMFATFERNGLHVRSTQNLTLWDGQPREEPDDFKALLVPGFDGLAVLDWSGSGAFFRRSGKFRPLRLSWSLADLRNDLGQPVPLVWFRWASDMALAGVDFNGNLHWSRLAFEDEFPKEIATATAVLDGGYVAAAIVKPGMVAGVTSSVINWLRTSERRFLLVASTALSRGAPVIGAFMSRPTNELLVLRSDGVIERVVAPGA